MMQKDVCLLMVAKEKIHLDRWIHQRAKWTLANANTRCCTTMLMQPQPAFKPFFLKWAFARLKNVEVSYRLPIDWSEKVGMSECRLYVNGNNLFTCIT